MNANLIRYEPGAKADVYAGERIVDVDHADRADDVHLRMGNLNDDGSYPVLTPMVSNYLPGVESPAYPEGIGGYTLPGDRGLLDQLHALRAERNRHLRPVAAQSLLRGCPDGTADPRIPDGHRRQGRHRHRPSRW